ncbi:hypothetical protein [Phytohabitans rumicis]|uniref:hypothetical protein n=1 Tax=Phytohabitans rumicis TaxID=1076125 RepID=UPI001C499D3C|nr:hypothetical protein [Phytohabitans rumicis]
MTALVIRPLIAGEEAAFGDTYTAMAAAGEYRPEWTWVALRDGVVVARAAWWAGPKDDKPLALDSPPRPAARSTPKGRPERPSPRASSAAAARSPAVTAG